MTSPEIFKGNFKFPTTLDDWNAFRKQNKGKFKKEKYGSVPAANEAKSQQYQKENTTK